MAGVDKNDVQRDEKRRRRLDEEFQREENERKRKEAECLLMEHDDPNLLDIEPTTEEVAEEAPKAKKKKDTVQLILPANISSHPEITACMDRIQLSSDKGSMLLSTIARIGGAKVRLIC